MDWWLGERVVYSHHNMLCGYAKATTVDIVASTGGLSKTQGIPSTRVNYSLTISRDLQQSLINGLTYIYSNYCHSSTLLHPPGGHEVSQSILSFVQ